MEWGRPTRSLSISAVRPLMPSGTHNGGAIHRCIWGAATYAPLLISSGVPSHNFSHKNFSALSIFRTCPLFFLVKPRPLQRCVSMPQTESACTSSAFESIFLWHMRNSENRLHSWFVHPSLSGVRWVTSSAGDGLARTRVCNWHQKSRAWRPFLCFARGVGHPGSSGRAVTKLVSSHLSAIRSVWPAFRADHTIRFRLSC